MNDFEIIRMALKESKKLAFVGRYGGLGDLYTLCAEAVQALDRIEKNSLVSLPLFSVGKTDGAELVVSGGK